MHRRRNVVVSLLLPVVWLLVLAAARGSSPDRASSSFSVQGKANIKCECTTRATGSTGCPPWERADKSEIYPYHVIIHVKPDLEVDLVDLCYRKRDDGAQISCCDVEAADQRSKYYRGSVDAIEKE